MGSKFGDAMEFLGKAVIGKATGIDILGEELQQRFEATKAAISGTNQLHQQVMDVAESTYNHLLEFIANCKENNIKFYPEFQVTESIDKIEDLRQAFWAQSKKCSDEMASHRSYPQYLESINSNLVPLAEKFTKTVQAFINNLHAPAKLSEFAEKVENIGDEVTFFLGSEKAKELRNFSEVEKQGHEVLNIVAYLLEEKTSELISSFQPFGDSDSSNWREEFNAVLKKLDAENKKFKMLISGSNVDSATSSERETPAEKIKALGELLNLGLISEKEFKEKKAQLLKQI